MEMVDKSPGERESSPESSERFHPNTRARVKKAVKWLGAIAGLLFVVFIVMVILEICPPWTPWQRAAWCVTSSLESAAEDGLHETPDRGDVSLPELRVEALTQVAETIFGRLSCVQRNHDRNIIGLGLYAPEFQGTSSTESIARYADDGYLDCLRFLECTGPYTIPDNYLTPLAEDGAFTMAEGVCESEITSKMYFVDLTGEVISGERLLEEELLTIDIATLTGQGLETEDIESVLEDALQPGDMRLTTIDGWTEVLWSPLIELQQPMDSFIEYHLWNKENDLEALVLEWFKERMQIMDIPDIVIEVFQESDGSGWYASSPAQPENEIASMDVVVEVSGDMTGTIKERRPLAFTALGELPELGPLTGAGTLNVSHPTLGLLYFEVEFTWEYWDRMGRVSRGEMWMVEKNSGYEIRLDFHPDGTKQGWLYIDDVLVRRVDVIVDGDIFYMKPYPLE